MKKIIIGFLIVVFSISILSSRPFKILNIDKKTSRSPQWTKDGKNWKELKKGDSFNDELIGFSIPKKVVVTIAYKRNKKSYNGPMNILLSQIKKDLNPKKESNNVVFAVLNGVKNMIFSKSDVSEGSTRSVSKNKTETLFFFNGLPDIISEKEISKVQFYACYGNPTDFSTNEELLNDEVKSNQYTFSDYDFSSLYKTGIDETSDNLYLLQVILKDQNKIQFIVKFISNEEYKIYSSYAGFDTLKEHIYSSQDFLNEEKLKKFIGQVQIKL